MQAVSGLYMSCGPGLITCRKIAGEDIAAVFSTDYWARKWSLLHNLIHQTQTQMECGKTLRFEGVLFHVYISIWGGVLEWRAE
jgi:hypothetical protein